MADQDSSTPTEAGTGGAGATPRADDRNETLDESPVPDPEAKDTDAEDVPSAD